MAAGESRLQQILKLSYEALSHLQFQDTVAQSLLGCQGQMAQAINEVERWMKSGDEGFVDAQVAAQTTAEEASTIESGDVMLF
jgi:hypothetical protein